MMLRKFMKNRRRKLHRHTLHNLLTDVQDIFNAYAKSPERICKITLTFGQNHLNIRAKLSEHTKKIYVPNFGTYIPNNETYIPNFGTYVSHFGT